MFINYLEHQLIAYYDSSKLNETNLCIASFTLYYINA